MVRIQCFLLVPTETARRRLRRYSGGKCPSEFGYHDASILVGDEVAFTDKTADGLSRPVSDDGKEHPGWPETCQCGYAFGPKDEYQDTLMRVFVREDNGERMLLCDAPVGAMWHVCWLPDACGSKHHTARGGGPHLLVRTPGGDWDIDAPSESGEGWNRAGDAPAVTVDGSVQMPGFHAHLRGGVLEEVP